jgi:hypothetical protein
MRSALAAGAHCVWVTTRIARTTTDPEIRRDAMETLADIAVLSPYERLQFAAASALTSLVGAAGWSAETMRNAALGTGAGPAGDAA